MLQVSYIRNNKEKVIQGLEKRRFFEAGKEIESILNKDERRRNYQYQYDELLYQINLQAKKNAALLKEERAEELYDELYDKLLYLYDKLLYLIKKAKQNATLLKEERADELKKRKQAGILLKQKNKELHNQVLKLDREIKEHLYHIPNLSQSVPEGKNSSDNVVILEKRGFFKADKEIESILNYDEKRRKYQYQYIELLYQINLQAKKNAALLKEERAEELYDELYDKLLYLYDKLLYLIKKAKQNAVLFKENRLEELNKRRQAGISLKQKSKELHNQILKLDRDIKEHLYHIPNLPHKRVPEGKNSLDNVVILEKREKPNLFKNALSHWELAKKYGMVDFDLGNKVSGAGFPFYKGKGAKLQRALINFFLDEAIETGYIEIQPPILVKEDSVRATGQLPDKEGQMYKVLNENLYLIPTSEVPLTNIFRDEIIEEKELPIKMVGYTPCFRREAGSWGSHVRGLNRLHQFDKVELVQLAHPESSYLLLEEMSQYVEQLLGKLELPYRKVCLCGGDLSFNASFCYDMEVYSGGQKKWLEVSSMSNFETYQANRLKLRYRDKKNKKHLVHTLNASALALPRIVAALLENNQTKDSIKLPKILHKYCGFCEIT